MKPRASHSKALRSPASLPKTAKPTTRNPTSSRQARTDQAPNGERRPAVADAVADAAGAAGRGWSRRIDRGRTSAGIAAGSLERLADFDGAVHTANPAVDAA